MPRKNRQASQSGIYHFINRGVNKKKLFHSAKDYERYLALMKEHSEALNVQIYHYCLMNNHTHILLKVLDLGSLSRFGYYLQRRYAYYYCKTYHWSEQVFRKRFISLAIDNDSYLLECGRYIERNPVRAKLIEDPTNFEYSSYGFYGFGRKNDLLTSNPLYVGLGQTNMERMRAYRRYVSEERAYEELVDQALVPF